MISRKETPGTSQRRVPAMTTEPIFKMPSSRAIMAPWMSMPPRRSTIALARGTRWVIVGWIASLDATSATAADCVLQADVATTLTADYVNALDPAETDSTVSVVNPLARVFYSLTGQAIDGVQIPATLKTARRTFSSASISLAYGPSDTPVRLWM